MGIKVEFKGVKPEDLVRNLERAVRTEVLVGIPRATAMREGDTISNAEIAYINEHGDPAQRIPPRPFMEPGLARCRDEVREAMAQGVQQLGTGGTLRPAAERVGLICQASIRGVFTDNDWKPLSPRTIMARAQRTVSKRKGFDEKSDRQQQNMLAKELARRANDRPLIDTGALRQSITYVVTEGGGDGQ